MGDLQKIAALWMKTGPKGTFYSGKLDAAVAKAALDSGCTRLLLFKVKNKKNERQPDLELFAAEDRNAPKAPRDPIAPEVQPAVAGEPVETPKEDREFETWLEEE